MRAIVTTAVPGFREAMRQFALNVGLECTAQDTVDLDEVPTRMALAPPDVVLVMLAGADVEAPLALVQKIHAQVPVFVIGSGQDPQLILRAQRAGARQYIDQNNLRDELAAALETLQQVNAASLKRGRTMVVTAPNPGSGVTTVASGLAFALGRRYPEQVALAELGNDVPELAIDLDFHPHNTIANLLHDWERLDAAMVKQTRYEHPAGVHVLAHQAETLRVEPPAPEAVRQTLRLLRTLYDFTIIDLGFALHSSAVEAVKMAEAVVVVVRLDVPSLRLNRQYLKELYDLGVPIEKIKPVINRYGQKSQITWRTVPKQLGLEPLLWIPEDPGSINFAINNGKPLVQTARWARITKRFDELAHQLNGSV